MVKQHLLDCEIFIEFGSYRSAIKLNPSTLSIFLKNDSWLDYQESLIEEEEEPIKIEITKPVKIENAENPLKVITEEAEPKTWFDKLSKRSRQIVEISGAISILYTALTILIGIVSLITGGALLKSILTFMCK